ncbi:hypothetical protein AMECASPLE_035558 [Ameca splendens]|uniref:Uncharacterized protein n=1 Tax=Ameca splendens TaxID=208324 RepID=A0ABV0Z6C9_9TELE
MEQIDAERLFIFGSGGKRHKLLCEWFRMDTQEDNMDFNEWTPVSRGRGQGRGKAEEGKILDSQRSKRELEENSSEEERVVRRKIGREECKILNLKNVEKEPESYFNF